MRLVVPEDQRRPDPPPLPSDDRAPVWAGVAIWSVLLVAAVLNRDDLAAQGRGWWLWTPVVGIALGLFGIRWLRRQGH